MIYILHGDDASSSRDFILRLQDQNKVTKKTEVTFDGIDLTALKIELSALDMFSESRMLVLDMSKVGKSNVDSLIEVLENVPCDLLLVIFTNKELSKVNPFIKAALKLKAKVMEFKKRPSANIFAFVDAVFDKNRPQAFKELQKLLLMGEDAVYLITMLSYGLRNVAYAKFNSPLFEKIPPFNKGKVRAQAAKFSESGVVSLIEQFYEMDRGVKFGDFDPNVVIPMALEKVMASR